MTKLRDGYFRQVDSKVGDDNYLLKAKGGYIGLHTGRNNEANKVVRTDEYGYIQAGWINTTSGGMDGSTPTRIYASYDGYIRYMTPAYFFPNLSNLGTSISVTVGGQNRTLVVNYATYASFIKGPDNRSTDNAPSWYMSNRGSASIFSEFCMTGGAWSSRYENRVTFTPWSNNSGERPVQMAFNNSGAALRTSASDSSWNSWYYILTSGNYSNYVYSKTDSDNRYVNVTGDTMTDALTFPKLIYNWTSSQAKEIICLKDAETYGIWYHEGDPDRMMFSASGNGSDYTTADLAINGAGAGTVTIRGNKILEANNYIDYTVTKTGGGASGTWSININGNAASASKLQTARKIWGQNFDGTADIDGTLYLHRSSSSSYGRISFYNESYYTWFIYMTPTGSSSPTGTNDPSGTYVTSWSIRSLIEDISGYGWTWESCSNSSGATPDIKMELSSNTGDFWIKGSATSTGFKKKNSSDSYFLLGGGGHTATSNYSLSTHNHNSTYLYRTTDTFKGTLTINGNGSLPLYIHSGTSGYQHGIVIKSASSWSGILLGDSNVTATSGATSNSYWIGNNEGLFCISKGSAGNTSVSLYCNGSNWYTNTNLILHSGNTYVSSNKGYINNTEITYVNNAGSASAADKLNFERVSDMHATTGWRFFTLNNRSPSNGPSTNGWAQGVTFLPNNDTNGYRHIITFWGEGTDNELWIKNQWAGSWGSWRKLLTSANSSVSKSGETLTVKINGTSYSLTNSTYNFYGTSFYSGYSSGSEHNCNNAAANGHYYYTSNGPSGIGNTTNDGALYVQSYSSDWVAQIAQDYRNGRLFVRGRNNGTWTSWLRVALYSEIPASVSIDYTIWRDISSSVDYKIQVVSTLPSSTNSNTFYIIV